MQTTLWAVLWRFNWLSVFIDIDNNQILANADDHLVQGRSRTARVRHAVRR
ncbi:MAG: hypothetical protein ABJ251_02350 [Paracoccaceae bacterium]